MQIGNVNVFIGAYQERQALNGADFRRVSAEKREELASKAASAMEEIREKRGAAVSVCLSPEARAFLCSDEAYQKMRDDTAELYAKHVERQKELAKGHEGDPFRANTGNQWLVLSESLYKGGFYDGMSDGEVRAAETALAKITSGMDHFSRTQNHTGMDFSDYYEGNQGTFAGKDALQAELESAVAALRDFSEQYVPDGQRENFQELIEAFCAHNAELIGNYQSPAESLQQAAVDMQNGTYQNSALNSPYAQDLKSR